MGDVSEKGLVVGVTAMESEATDAVVLEIHLAAHETVLLRRINRKGFAQQADVAELGSPTQVDQVPSRHSMEVELPVGREGLSGWGRAGCTAHGQDRSPMYKAAFIVGARRGIKASPHLPAPLKASINLKPSHRAQGQA